MEQYSANSLNPIQERLQFNLGVTTYQISTKTLLLIIIAIAICLRLASAIYQGNTVSDLPGIYDQISYDGLARRVVEGYGFSFAEGHWPATKAGEPTAHWSFLYTLYLAAIYKIFGLFPLIARVLQALTAGVLHTWFVYRIGQRVFSNRVGLLAAFFSAIYIYFFYYAGALITETFFIISILWIFDTTFRLFDRNDGLYNRKQLNQAWPLWGELGLAIGITTLLRQTILLFLPLLFLWLWWNLPGFSNRQIYRSLSIRLASWTAIRGMFLACLILMGMIIPWTIRNFKAFDTFILLNTNAGFAFYWSNHPIHGTRFLPLLPVTGPSYQDLIPDGLLNLNEGKLDQALMKAGIQIVLDDPYRYLLLSISRIEEFIKFWPSSDSSPISNLSRVGSFGLFLPFMVIGLIISFFKKTIFSTNGEILVKLLYIFMFFYTLLHLMSWTLIRYRLPVDSILLIFSAVSISQIGYITSSYLKKMQIGTVE